MIVLVGSSHLTPNRRREVVPGEVSSTERVCPEGEMVVHDNCSISECHLGTLRPYQGKLQVIPVILHSYCHLKKQTTAHDNKCNVSESPCVLKLLISIVLLPVCVGAGVRAPNVTFSVLVEKRCIYLEQMALTWDAARARCISRGGDLFVPGDFSGLGQHTSGHSQGEGN